MTPLRRVSYFGSDPDFIKELSKFIEKTGERDLELGIKTYSKGSILQTCVSSHPGIVFLDMTENTSGQDVLDEVIFIKRNKFLSSTLFIAVFPFQEMMEAYKTFLTAGFQLFFVKGLESETLFRDAFYIAYDRPTKFPSFAQVKDINKNITAGAASTLVSIEGNSFTVETDLEVSDYQLELTLPMFPDLHIKTFTILKRLTSSLHYPMQVAYTLELPMAGAWDEGVTENLRQDTLDTWKGLNQNMLSTGIIHVKVFSENLELFQQIYQTLDPLKFRMEFYTDYDSQCIDQNLITSDLGIIFYDFPVSPESGKNLENLGLLVDQILPSDIRPIIVSTNNPSKTQAIQKLFSYSSIMSSEKPLTEEVFSVLLKNFQQKKKDLNTEIYHFHPDSPNRALNILFNVTLTSLTEHEISFRSTIEIPMFSLLYFKIPVPFIATVVPPIAEMGQSRSANHYMAFINGVDESGLTILRKFVNKIIYNPLPDYNQQTIDSTLNQLGPASELAEKPQAPEVVPEKTIVTKKIETPKNKPRFKGKSKL